MDDLLETVGLTSQARQRVRHLSGGQRRRLDVAIGIVGRPELLFLDEPTAGFDPEARRDFHDLVHRLTDREQATILLTTHDLDEAEKLADRILILAGGAIIADGSADELARRMSAPGGGALEPRRAAVRARGRRIRPGSSASCSGSTASRSRTWRCAGPAWRTPTWHWSARRARWAAPVDGGGGMTCPVAARAGLSRGWIEFKQTLTTPRDLISILKRLVTFLAVMIWTPAHARARDTLLTRHRDLVSVLALDVGITARQYGRPDRGRT